VLKGRRKDEKVLPVVFISLAWMTWRLHWLSQVSSHPMLKELEKLTITAQNNSLEHLLATGTEREC